MAPQSKNYQKNMNSKVFNFSMSRNHSWKSQKCEFWTNLKLKYHQWPSLAHEYSFITCNPIRSSLNLCKKNYVQVRAWEVVAISKVIRYHFAHYKYLHNGGGRKSTILI